MNNQEIIQALKEHASEDVHRFEHIDEQLKDISKEIAKISESIVPLSEAYNGVLFGKKLLTGIAAVVLAIAAVGGGVIWLVDTITNRK